MNALLFIARRFVFGTREKTIKTMIRITAISILIGSCALALVAAVMNGFEQGTRKAIQGIHPDLIISSDQPLDYPKIADAITQEFKTKIIATSPYTQESALIKSPDSKTITQIVTVTGFDPNLEQKTTKLPSMIKQPVGATLDVLNEPHSVMIGATLAAMLCAQIGDEITVLHAPELSEETSAFSVEQATVKIAGIFKTGIDDFDAKVMFCSLPVFKSIFGHDRISTIGVTLAEPSCEQAVQKQLRDRLELDVVSWKELYPALLSALTLEKYAMFLILALILLVASMNIASLLFMFITQKKMEIGVLKTMGLTDKQITRIFMIIGVGLAMSSTLLGLIVASGASFLLNHFPIIKLPEVYFVSHLPATMTFSILVAVLIVVLLLSILSSYLATSGLRQIETSSVLKQTE